MTWRWCNKVGKWHTVLVGSMLGEWTLYNAGLGGRKGVRRKKRVRWKTKVARSFPWDSSAPTTVMRFVFSRITTMAKARLLSHYHHGEGSSSLALPPRWRLILPRFASVAKACLLLHYPCGPAVAMCFQPTVQCCRVLFSPPRFPGSFLSTITKQTDCSQHAVEFS